MAMPDFMSLLERYSKSSIHSRDPSRMRCFVTGIIMRMQLKMEVETTAAFYLSSTVSLAPHPTIIASHHTSAIWVLPISSLFGEVTQCNTLVLDASRSATTIFSFNGSIQLTDAW